MTAADQMREAMQPIAHRADCACPAHGSTPDLFTPESAASPFDAGRHQHPQGGEERWSARWLMDQMGYPTWQHFEPVIERAKTSAHNQGFNVRILFTVARENSGGRPRTDYSVTRFAAYLIAMNGDPRKADVAAAQAYFATKTREAEVASPPTSIAVSAEEQMALGLVAAQRLLAQKDEQLALAAPKVAAYDSFLDADGDYSVGSVAKMLGLSQNKLFNELRNRRVFIAKGSMRNTPYQQYMHHFVVKAKEFDRNDGSRSVSYTTYVQPSGIEFISRKVGQPLLTAVEQ